MRLRLMTVVAVLAASGCSGHAARVSDADYGRLNHDQMASVDTAREEAGRERDELARAKLQLADARHEIDLARADQTAADADIARSKIELKGAQEEGNGTKVDHAY